MRPPLYLRTLTDDLDHWIRDGLVPPDNRDAILASVRSQKSGPSAVGILAMLGAIFMALAGLSFMAANWGAISKLWRLGFVLTMMWGAFDVAILALKQKTMAFAHAFALLGAALFGIGIMLVAQTFNISAHYPNGILIWSIGALGVAMAMQSRPILLFASMLAALWMLVSYWGPMPGNPLMLAYVPLFLGLWLIARKTKAIESVHVIVLSTLVLAINLMILYYPDDQNAPAVGALYGVMALALVLWAGIGRGRATFGAEALQMWSGIALLISSFLIQFSFTDTATKGSTTPGLLWAILACSGFVLTLGAAILISRSQRPKLRSFLVPVLAAITLLVAPWLDMLIGSVMAHMVYGAIFFAGAVLAILQGVQNHQKALLWIGGIAFAAEALYAYFETFKDLLSTSLFFFLGGALLLVMALIAMRFNKRLKGGGSA
jgi:uncharacterized membrane protein